MAGNAYLNFFIHNSLAHFYRYFLDFLCTDEVYSRFNTKYMATYDKAVQYIEDKRSKGRETDKPDLPCVILNPSGEMTMADGNAGGKQLYRHPLLASGWNFQMYDSIYRDDNVNIVPAFARIKGEMEVITLMNSFYEYCDVRLMFLQRFSGTDRYFPMEGFSSYIIIPPDLYNFNYTNEATGEDYYLDWDKYGVDQRLIKTTNRSEYVYPCLIKPQIKMTGTSDGSSKYGGTDKLADWRMTSTFEYEIEVPWFLLMKSDYLAENIDLKIDIGSAYSTNLQEVPVHRTLSQFTYDIPFDTTAVLDTVVDYPDNADMTNTIDLKFNTRYYHVVTQAQDDATDEFSILIPETVDSRHKLIVATKSGVLEYGPDYILENNGTGIKFYVSDNDYAVNDVIEIYIYKII